MEIGANMPMQHEKVYENMIAFDWDPLGGPEVLKIPSRQ